MELRDTQFDILFKYMSLECGKIANIDNVRRSGLSTINGIYSLWLLLFYPETKLAMVSPNSSMVQNEKYIIYKLYDIFVTNWELSQFKNSIMDNSVLTLTFDNNSYIIFTWDMGNKLRGHSFDIIMYDNLGSNAHSYECFKNTALTGKKYIITNNSLT